MGPFRKSKGGVNDFHFFAENRSSLMAFDAQRRAPLPGGRGPQYWILFHLTGLTALSIGPRAQYLAYLLGLRAHILLLQGLYYSTNNGPHGPFIWALRPIYCSLYWAEGPIQQGQRPYRFAAIYYSNQWARGPFYWPRGPWGRALGPFLTAGNISANQNN